MHYMIEKISFKYFLDVFWPVLPRDLFKTQSKVYGGAIFANKVNNFQPLTTFTKKLHHRCSSGF